MFSFILDKAFMTLVIFMISCSPRLKLLICIYDRKIKEYEVNLYKSLHIISHPPLNEDMQCSFIKNVFSEKNNKFFCFFA